MGNAALVVLRWLVARWIYVLPTIIFAAYSGWVYHKGSNHGEAKIEKQVTKETKRIENVWDKIDRQPDDVGIALRRLRQRSGQNQD